MYDTISAQVDHISADDIFRMIVVYPFKVAELPFGIVICNKIRYLNLELLSVLVANKVDLLVIELTDPDLITATEHFKKNYVFV